MKAICDINMIDRWESARWGGGHQRLKDFFFITNELQYMKTWIEEQRKIFIVQDTKYIIFFSKWFSSHNLVIPFSKHVLYLLCYIRVNIWSNTRGLWVTIAFHSGELYCIVLFLIKQFNRSQLYSMNEDPGIPPFVDRLPCTWKKPVNMATYHIHHLDRHI